MSLAGRRRSRENGRRSTAFLSRGDRSPRPSTAPRRGRGPRRPCQYQGFCHTVALFSDQWQRTCWRAKLSVVLSARTRPDALRATKLIGISGQGICVMKNLTSLAMPGAAIVGVRMIAVFERVTSTSVAFGPTAPAMNPGVDRGPPRAPKKLSLRSRSGTMIAAQGGVAGSLDPSVTVAQ
jgi:hypothetical protein